MSWSGFGAVLGRPRADFSGWVGGSGSSQAVLGPRLRHPEIIWRSPGVKNELRWRPDGLRERQEELQVAPSAPPGTKSHLPKILSKFSEGESSLLQVWLRILMIFTTFYIAEIAFPPSVGIKHHIKKQLKR